jgi:hypothetical protein
MEKRELEIKVWKCGKWFITPQLIYGTYTDMGYTVGKIMLTCLRRGLEIEISL